MTGAVLRILEGFPGQRVVVLPRSVVSSWFEGDPLFDLLPTDVGHYPKAQWHFVERNEGVAQSVLIYCTEGSGWVRFGDLDLTILPGDAVLIPPHVPHAYGADHESPWTIYWVHLAGPKLPAVFRVLGLGRERALLHPGHDPALPTVFEKLLAVLADGYTPDNLLSSSMLLGQIVTHLAVARHRVRNRQSSHSEERIKRVIDMMHANLAGQLRVEDLARLANLSPSHLTAVFKKHTGFTLMDFFVRLKIQRACFLLDTTEYSIKDVAGELGFDDPLYFSRCFRRIHACSPTQYRALRKG